MSAIAIPSDSVDAFIAGQLPGWLKSADVDLLLTLHRALRHQQAAAEGVRNLLAQMPSIEAFATPLLETALGQSGLADADVRNMKVYIENDVPLPSAAPRLHTPWTTLHSNQPLLTAALHNFHEAETRPSVHRRAHLQDVHGIKLPLAFEAFASCCRTLDIGGRYQEMLHARLFPKSRPPAPEGFARAAVERVLEENLRAKMEVAVRMARIKSELDDVDYLRLLPVCASKPIVPAASGLATPRQLYLLGKRIHGPVAFEMRDSAAGPLSGIISWIPQDPSRQIARYPTWAALYQSLSKQLRAPHYRSFFCRFISERDKPTFTATLERLIQASDGKQPVDLDGRNFSIDMPLFAYLRAQQVDKILDDARVLAVPTGDETAIERHQRLEVLKSAGFDLLNLAALFVPVLGEVMMAVAAVDVVSEVYKGYADWRIGDRQGALDHLFGVAENLAVGTVIGAAQVGVGRVLERMPFVDALTPLHEGEGRYRLADRPVSAHHIDGGGALLRSLGGRWAQISDQSAETLLRVTGLEQDHLRHVHLQGEAPPARLLDAHERHELHTLEPHLQGAALERELAARQDQPSAAGALLIRVFPGLSVRGAESVLEQASGEQVKALLTTGRIPLEMAERARWLLRESRLDRALLGFEHQGAVNDATQRLVLKWVNELAPWPASVRIELRLGEAKGRLLASVGSTTATRVRCLVQTEQGYQLSDAPQPMIGQGLLACLIQTLEEGQKVALGEGLVDARALGNRVAQAASADRQKTAQLMGLRPIAERFRPPQRFADGRFGYALSGRGESSRQAIRRGIHEIFPTLTDAQLDAYLGDLMQRRIGLWDHLSTLQRQLDSLRDALDAWQRERVSFLDGRRRQRVASQIRRAWRRKTAGLAGDDFSLHIEGERVGSLPILPEGVEFAHVQRLTLRNMSLDHMDEQFLLRFSGVRELDLRDNQLVTLPAGLERLTALRRLHLAGNRIAFDAQSNLRLASLSMLQQLDLTYNPLGLVPDLSGLRHLREVSLRATGLQALPDASALPWRGLVDFRENQIRQVTDDLRNLNGRLQRLSLHDNPLDEASESLLARSASSDYPANRRSSYHHAIADANLQERWLGSITGDLLEQRRALWARLAEEPQSADLFRYLADFARSDDFRDHPRYYRARVWRILELCADNTDVREAVFWQVQGPRTCEDQLLLILSQLEVRAHIALHSAEAGTARAEATLLRLGRSLYRLDQVDSIASRHIEEMRQNPYASVDDIEVYLAYRVNLADPLGLPAQPQHMHYPEHSGVTGTRILRARAQVVAGESTEALSNALAQREFWQGYVRNRYAERFEALAAPYHEQLEAFERETGESGEQLYLERADALMAALNAEERALYLELAREAYEREV
ncbi:NEL-type E3 ubiquitin ligase domain-containing protein [Pseudomonas sp. NPDC089743]|uniref:NEL-type E3 ubiquitin ligase domain-containing protein n=1 Tax=Pseudomonas sp. NPDC089743 TaxID=3364471 RepID=UPI00380060B3